MRRSTPIGAVLLACCLLLLASGWVAVRLHADGAARAVSSVQFTQDPRWATDQDRAQPQRGLSESAASLGQCEARIERAPHRAPTVAIVGASYTAGIGPGNPAQSWAVGLAQMLHWNAVVYGVPGAGYVAGGYTGRGPVARMLRREQLRQLDPALVIVQAGHDDLGVPAALERSQVAATVGLIRTAAPGARIALLTAFGVAVDGTAALRDTDAAIVSAALGADPGAVIMDPVGSRWRFARADGGLHPTAGGDAWIARTVARILVARGVRAARAPAPAPVICDVSVGAGPPVIA